MNRSPENQPDDVNDFDALIAAWQAGEIMPQEWDRLCALLRSDLAARDRFLLHMQVEAGLHWKFSERSRVSAVLAEDFPQTAPPLNLSSLADGSYSRDDAYRQIMELVANQEANDLLWAQAYPRLRSYAVFCLPRTTDVESAVSSIAKLIADRYHDRLSSVEFEQLIRGSARKVIQEWLAILGGPTRALEEWIAAGCLGQPEDCASLSVSALYERLEAYVPFRVSEDRLQLLCLRYLHELTPEQIATHLSSTQERMQLELAKTRIFIWKQCCEQHFNQASQSEIDHLLMVSLLVDRRTLTADALERLQQWLRASERHRHILGSFALLHECIYRQLTVERLLESLTKSKKKSFQNAVGKAIRQIETFARKTTAQPAPTIARVPGAKWVTATTLATAGLLLFAIALVLHESRHRAEHPQIAQTKPAMPAQPVTPPAPPPIVATVTERLNVVTNSFPAMGAEIRKGDSMSLRDGILELITASGSTLVLEAPVDVVFQNEFEITMKQGKLAGLNSTKEQKLIVHTPTATVEDLGTEFGVRVRKDGSTAVAVYQGAVEISGAQPGDDQRTLEVGWQTSIDEHGASDKEPAALVHEREFVRPDEVKLRVAAKQGSPIARSQVAFYELLRIEGIVAYEGFSSETDTKQLTTGFRPQGLRPSQGITFGNNLSEGTQLSAQSQSIVAADERRYFLDLDTSEHSELVHSGLLAPGGLIGDQPGDVWISWRSQLQGTQNHRPDWAGLSFMCGDERQKDEPLFVGLLAGNSYGVGIFDGPDRAERHYELDLDTANDGIQPMPIGEQQNFWIVHLSMRPESTEVRVWCNIPINRVATELPNARETIEKLRFDRFRLEVRSSGEVSTCSFDDLLVATNREALEAGLKIIERPTQNNPAE